MRQFFNEKDTSDNVTQCENNIGISSRKRKRVTTINTTDEENDDRRNESEAHNDEPIDIASDGGSESDGNSNNNDSSGSKSTDESTITDEGHRRLIRNPRNREEHSLAIICNNIRQISDLLVEQKEMMRLVCVSELLIMQY